MTALDDLLVVQEHDTALERLRHRRATLPERAELARVGDEIAGVERSAGELGAQRDVIARGQKKLEDELGTVEAKVAEIQARLYSGAVNIPRELQAMQAEVDSLRKRCGTLEDGVLDAMTEREPLEDELGRLDARRAELDAEGGRLRAAVAEAEVAIDVEMAGEQEARAGAAAGVPAELARLYEDLRRKLAGVGAARLVNGRCGGCHLTLPATELDRIRKEPPDAVIRCDQCGRILVR